MVRFLDLVLERFVSNSSFVVIVGDGGGDVCSMDVRGSEESAGKWWLLVKGNLSASMCFQLFLWEVVWTTREGERLGGWSGYLRCIWGCVRVCVYALLYTCGSITPLCVSGTSSTRISCLSVKHAMERVDTIGTYGGCGGSGGDGRG